MFEFSEALKEFFSKRDRATNGLQGCDQYLSPAEISDLGYRKVRSEYFEEGKCEYEFYVYEKEGKRVVCNEVYEEREGGMHHQTLFTEDGQLP